MSEDLWFGSRHWQHIFLLFSKASRTGSGARLATYAVGIGGAFPVGKATWAWSWPLIPIYCWGWEVIPLLFPIIFHVVQSSRGVFRYLFVNPFFLSVFLLFIYLFIFRSSVSRIRNSGLFEFWSNSDTTSIWDVWHNTLDVSPQGPCLHEAKQRRHATLPSNWNLNHYLGVRVVQESSTDRRLILQQVFNIVWTCGKDSTGLESGSL